MKNWNPTERAKRLRNYRLFIRASGPMLVLGVIITAAGVGGGGAVMLMLGVVLFVFAALNTWQSLRSTMHIVELDERDARRAREWGGDPSAGA